MGRGKDFREPRRRGFDDDAPSYESPYGRRGGGSAPGGGAPRPFGGSPPGAAGGGFSAASAPTGPVIEATVKWFNPEKGFGFAALADGSGDAFLHINALQAAGHDSLAPGAVLKVQVTQGAKGPQIAKVIEVDASQAQEPAPRSPAPRSDFGGGGGGGGARPARRPVDTSNATELAGNVKWFNAEKGFGFVACEDGGKDVFIHISVAEANGVSSLAEGQPVTMRVVTTQKGREAVSISVA